jgi:hypothetical protein
VILTPGKIVLFSSYLLIGAYLAFIFPWKRLSVLFQGESIASNPPNISNYRSLHWLAGVLGIAALTLIPWWYVAISLLISASIHYKNRITKNYIGSSIFIGLIFASFLPWWLHNSKNRLQISISQTLIFLAITTTVYLLFTKAQKLNALSGKLWASRLIDTSFIAALLAVYAMSISVSISTADFAQWHHWGAYIGPAELIFNGVYPLYDIPMQYGLGPSLAIASGCQWGCWNSLFWVVTICNLLFAFVLARIALYLYQPRNWVDRALVLLVILLLCVFWLSHPISLQGPNAFPSGNSLRFLPGLLMLYLILQNNHQSKNIAYTFRLFQFQTISIFSLWILSFVWSPEAGIHTTCLLVPYFFWRALSVSSKAEHIQCAALTLCKLIGVFVGGILSTSIVFYLLLGVWPSVSLYLTYIVNPINPSPVNPNGPIWVIVIIAYLIWSWSQKYSENNSDANLAQPLLSNAWLVALLCFANFSYCLGRSSDGNLIAMLPYFLLAVLIVQRWSAPGPNKTLSSILLASIIGWAAIPTHINNYAIAFSRDDLISIDASRIANAFDRGNPQSVFFIKFDKPVERQKLESAQSAITYLRAHFNESIETFDRYSLIEAKDPNPPWNALFGPANFPEIPSVLRREYLLNVAKRLNRSGWVLFDKDYKEMQRFLEDYDSVYQRTQTIDFGYYTAIRYSPRQ